MKIKVEKYNEIYNKIYCEPSTSYELKDYFTFRVPGCEFVPSYRNKLWDGNIYLYNHLTCLLYGGLNDHLKEFSISRKYDLEFSDEFKDNDFSYQEALDFFSTLNLPFQPRDYQINSFLTCVRKNRKTILSPTGSGKSFLLYLLTRYYNKKTLIIVPNTSLIHQLNSDFISYGLDESEYIHKIYQGQDKSSDSKYFISTWQSIYKQPKEWYNQFDVVIVDECHLVKAKSLTTIMNKLENCKYRFGFTGTLDGTNTHKLMIESLFGSVEKIISTNELIENKVLSDFIIKSLILNYPDEIKKMVSKLTYQEEMDYIVSLKPRNKFIRNLSLSLEGNTLLLFQYVEKHGALLYNMIKEKDPNREVYFVHGGISGEERERIRKVVDKSNNSIIVASYQTFSTGINIKNLHNVIFSSPSKSKIRNLQSIGRGLRKSDSKDQAVLYDIADNLSWKSKKNYTLLHYMERMKTYNEEKFNYKIYNIDIKI